MLVKLIVCQNVNVKINGPRRNAKITANRKTKNAMTMFVYLNVGTFAICAMEEPVITRNQLKCSPMGSGNRFILYSAVLRFPAQQMQSFALLFGVAIFSVFFTAQSLLRRSGSKSSTITKLVDNFSFFKISKN